MSRLINIILTYKLFLAIGRGRTSSTSDQLADVTQYIETKVLPGSTCEQLYTTNFDTNMQVCIDDDGKAICSGDSGGPLILKVSLLFIKLKINIYK